MYVEVIAIQSIAGFFGTQFVCLSVCLSFLSIRSQVSKTARPNFTKFSVHFTYGRCSVLI